MSEQQLDKKGAYSSDAIASLVFACLSIFLNAWGIIAGLIYGHLALRQIKKDPEIKGIGIAKAGIRIAYIFLILFAVNIFLFMNLKFTTQQYDMQENNSFNIKRQKFKAQGTIFGIKICSLAGTFVWNCTPSHETASIENITWSGWYIGLGSYLSHFTADASEFDYCDEIDEETEKKQIRYEVHLGIAIKKHYNFLIGYSSHDKWQQDVNTNCPCRSD